MLIKKSNSIKSKNSDSCTVSEYDLPSKNLSLATAIINGRYPDQGMSANTDCELVYYCIDGRGVVHLEDDQSYLEPGDVYYIPKQVKYFIEGNNLELVILNAPKWTKEQYQHFE